ncbi:PREDICTED: tonsoku-like protein isoform X2 [Ceratosolen solmsi marchali]|uniref:Tonsoku-like protein isoform X2 n=1 Tax=Ceratosolen solmsi marchali TaxID=326594 RepID=A0AAJ7DZL4_9HYME|nr:PREDICTED: tonsoku-like protein isoform X2 [Ceratosolen solmsi marchali]
MDEEGLLKKRNKAQRDGNVQILSDVQKKLGDLFYDKKCYQDALEAYKGQLHACESISDRLNCAIAHRMIGEVYAEIENFNEALSHQNLHLEIAKELKDQIEEQRAYATLGRTHLLVAESLIKESDSDKKAEVLKNAKRAFSKSIRLCDKLENKIDISELLTMRARLLLNLGLVLEQQKDTEEALSLIKQAALLCRKHNLYEDLHRTNIALAGLNERLGNCELAIKHMNDAAEVDDIYLKADAQLLKAELLLKLGEWMEAQKILYHLYKSKHLLEPIRQQVTKLLRIAVVLCRSEDKLLIEDDLSIKEKLYETMGDAAIAVRSLDKAVYYYRNMLTCAEKTKSGQIGAALTSLAQTLRDAGKFQEAISYARRELESCSNGKDTCNCALYLADLLVDANAPENEIREMYNRAVISAKDCEDRNLEKSAIKDYIEYLEKSDNVDVKLIVSLNERLGGDLSSSQSDCAHSEENESPDIGADICLDDLSDLDENLSDEQKHIVSKSTTRRTRYIMKKNEKGESLLHVACIKGNIATVEKLLEEQHPTDVRDHCGWTPLHEASNHGYVDIVRQLVHAGANVNDPGGTNCDGVTALHDAAANGHTAVVQLLLDNGANPNLLTSSGESALDCLEQWRDRVGELTSSELKEYVYAKRRLADLVTVKSRRKSNRERTSKGWNALVDEEDETIVVERKPNTLDTWSSLTENISVGEDYKRTIASMQHPGRLKLLSKQAPAPRITAPLIDSEEVLIDDWLEEDLLPAKRRDRQLQPDCLPALTSTAKRKSNNDSDREIERDVDKCIKRQKITTSSVTNEQQQTSLRLINDDSCESNANESNFDSFDELLAWPRKRLPNKRRQTNLLKQGFTKSVRSRSPSLSPELQVPQSNQENHISETIDLEIIVDGETFELTLHMRDLGKTMSDIEELIRHKFEAKTGCRPKISFNTEDNVTLAPEIILEEVPRGRNKLRLFGIITANDLPPIADRYNKVCETLGVSITDSMLKSLRSCDNTSTFRLNVNDSVPEELEPLAKCLHYQHSLQSLVLSRTTLVGQGELLNYVMTGLSGLGELHLQCCDINVNCLSKIDRLPPQIRVLDLSYNPLGHGSQKKLYELLEPLKRLQTLGLCACELDGFEFNLGSPSLVDLDISWNRIGGEGAVNLLQRQLLNLNLSNTQSFDCNCANVIDKIFFTDSLKFSLFALESLELSSCLATDFDVEKILSQTPNLMKINLSNNINVTRTSLCAILARKPTMSHIDLSGCRLINAPPEANLKLITPQICTLLVHMTHDVIDYWEILWRGRGHSKKLPHNLIVFKPL